MSKLWSLAKKTFLPVIGVPLLMLVSGIFSNEMVLVTNQASFPVMLNSADIKVLQKNADEQEQWNNDQFILPDNFSVLNTSVNVQRDEIGPGGMIDRVHRVMKHSDHFKFLADWIRLGDGIYSPGDMFIMLGSFFWGFAPIVWGTLAIRKLTEKQNA